RYSSPEILQGSISRHSDQYSLAIVYQELLTGSPPFRGKNFHHLLVQHLTAEPDLGGLPDADRPAVARALAHGPDQRSSPCVDVVVALLAGREAETSETVRLNLAQTKLSGVLRRLPAQERPSGLIDLAPPAPANGPSAGSPPPDQPDPTPEAQA